MALHVPIARAKYVWVYGVDPNSGKGAIVGPFRDEDTARADTREFDAVRVWELPTKDQSRASQMIRAKLARSHGLRYALSKKRRVKAGQPEGGPDPAPSETLFDEDEE